MNYLAHYFIIISMIALILTLYDKQAAIRRFWRVPERTLFFISVLGGASIMLAAMLLFRHKTRHAKFMIGLPVIVVLQIVVGLAALHWAGYFG
jgi:uncharacterized membrane protein YsdA (DUF1294 family)